MVLQYIDGWSISDSDSGMEFQMTGDEWQKARWPIVRLVWNTVKRSWLLDCNERECWHEGFI